MVFDVWKTFCFLFFLHKIFLMWTIFKVFIELVTTLPLFSFSFFFFFLPIGMWDPSSPTRHQTHTTDTWRQSPNHRTVREVPTPSVFKWRNLMARKKPQQGVEQNVVCSLGINIMNRVDSTTQRGMLEKLKTFNFIPFSTGNRKWRSVVDSH